MSAPATNQVATQAPRLLSPVDALKNSITALSPEIKKVLPPHVSVDKFNRIVFNALQTTPALIQADRPSFFKACLDLAAQGLMPDGREAAIVPFKGKAQAMPMVAGLLKLIRNSGELSSITPNIVYENDTFDYWVDEKGEHLMHRPVWKDQGQILLAYCMAVTKDGGVYISVMTLDQIEAIRDRSQTPEKGPWATDYEEMCKKTVIRRLYKRLPSSTDIEGAIHADDDLFMPEPASGVPAQSPVMQDAAQQSAPAPQLTQETASKVVGPSRLSGIINAKSKPVQAPVAQAAAQPQVERAASIETPAALEAEADLTTSEDDVPL